MDEDIYEVLPVDPIQKLEREISDLKRILKLKEKEQSEYVSSITKEMIELVKVTQNVISTFVKTNTELQTKLADLSSKIEILFDEVRELVDILREAAIEAKEEESKPVKVYVDLSKLESKFDELKSSNEELKTILEEIKNLLKSSGRRPMPLPPLPPKPFIPRR